MRSLAIIAALAATSATADLRDETQITEGIIAVGIAYEVSQQCPSISPRRIRGINYLYALKGMASDLGYSDAEIEAFIDNKSEEKRLEGIARQRLAARGASAGSPESFCVIGREEMAKGSAIGRLLR